MPLLGPESPRGGAPIQRVLVAGTSGSGKTTLARRIARALDIPHIEIDALFHGPGWTARPSFVEDVEAFSRQLRWVTEWQYGIVRERLADRCDLVVWLDLPKRTVMRQVSARTVRRRVRRERLWNGNIEPPLRTILTDPQYVVRWAWTTHGQTGERIAALRERRPELPVVRLRSHRESDGWLAAASCNSP